MAVMTVTGVGLFVFSDFIMQLLTPVTDISSLGAEVLRIEAFAEPLFAASIVASGVFRGAGDTFVPSIMNLFSMWAVRIPLSAFLAPRVGLRGVWIAMCIELCVRGALFLIRLYIKTRKLKKPENGKKEAAVSR
jgi:Na+-driven multidrug efflux pump